MKQALSLIRQLGLRPRRTLRVVLWTAEEIGGFGAKQYFEQHKVLPFYFFIQIFHFVLQIC